MSSTLIHLRNFPVISRPNSPPPSPTISPIPSCTYQSNSSPSVKHRAGTSFLRRRVFLPARGGLWGSVLFVVFLGVTFIKLKIINFDGWNEMSIQSKSIVPLSPGSAFISVIVVFLCPIVSLLNFHRII